MDWNLLLYKIDLILISLAFAFNKLNFQFFYLELLLCIYQNLYVVMVLSTNDSSLSVVFREFLFQKTFISNIHFTLIRSILIAERQMCLLDSKSIVSIVINWRLKMKTESCAYEIFSRLNWFYFFFNSQFIEQVAYLRIVKVFFK